MRLIDADALYDKVMGTPTDLYYPSKYGALVKDMPTIDPIKHAHWIFQDRNAWYRCSNCRHEAVGKLPYCGFCGAKMDEVTKIQEDK